MSYNFTQNEMLTIIDEYKKICINPNGLITPENLMDFPPFHYSPFGYHILDVFDLNEKADSEDKKKDDKLKIKGKEKEKEKDKKKGKNKKDNEKQETNDDLISDLPEMKDTENDGKSVGIQDFVYFVYLFSSHAKVLERAQLYFRLFDFDNDGKITPSDIIVYLENLDRDTEKVLKETKKFFNKERKINKEDYILELDDFKGANENRQIANLIIKESGSKGKGYLDFFDFRNMFLNMQFIPEYYNPLYLEEKFNDGRVGGGGLVKKEEKKEEKKEDKDEKATNEVVVPVKSEGENKDKKEDEKTAQESNGKSKKDKQENGVLNLNNDEEEAEEEDED
jgi:Ca2+-binding EF-hand superfamily protein